MPKAGYYKEYITRHGNRCPTCNEIIDPSAKTCRNHTQKMLDSVASKSAKTKKRKYKTKPPKPAQQLGSVVGLSIPQRIHNKYGTTREMMESLWKK